MSRVMKAVPLAVLCVLIIAVPSVWAYWVQDGLALCTATGDQLSPTITSDGAGGAIVTWHDYRSGNYDIYVQRLNASGSVQWTTDGVAICTAANIQSFPTIVSDGAGGAIVTWYDYRSGSNNDIYAQRVNASGAVQWTANGVALCTATGDQWSPMITSDGAGGAIVTWYDYRSGNSDIYAQRLNASGTPQWTANGVAICTAAADQQLPQITSDGTGGAIVTWTDFRSGSNTDIYAQRLNASGAVQWTTDGVALCAATNSQSSPTIISDGAGGAIVTWTDYRSGTNYDIYAQRVNASGAVQWTANGVALCTATNSQSSPKITSDGAGGAIVAWYDYRSGINYDIYIQKLNASGTPQWTANGVALCTAAADQQLPQITSDGTGGAIVTWYDYRSGNNNDIYAQRVNASGAVQWTANGVALCTATGHQYNPQITSDGAGGAIVTWYDYRSGNSDIYAQQVSGSGKTGFLNPAIHSIRDVPGDQGGSVNLAWDASRADYFSGDITRYTIWRALSTPAALMMIKDGAALLSGPEEISSTTSKAQVRMEQVGGLTFYWSLIDSHDAYYLQNYSKLVATAFDSSSATTQYNYFQIIAHTSDARTFFISAPDSGRSVDNIAPCPPVGLAGQQSYTPAGLDMTWDRNTEADLGHYAVYRGTSAGFVPGAGNLVASPCDTTLLDSGWRWSEGYYYKVSAIDIHGNESGFALLSPDGVTGTDTPKAPEAAYLRQNYPNPFNPTTRIAFGLSAPAHVSLRIYDAAGRLVRALVNEERRAGKYEESWDGRDSNGRSVASGIYFYKLAAGSFVETRKMALLR
jgi:predicted lipoprotein with Yx(FWY)xxD motif